MERQRVDDTVQLLRSQYPWPFLSDDFMEELCDEFKEWCKVATHEIWHTPYRIITEATPPEILNKIFDDRP